MDKKSLNSNKKEDGYFITNYHNPFQLYSNSSILRKNTQISGRTTEIPPQRTFKQKPFKRA